MLGVNPRSQIEMIHSTKEKRKTEQQNENKTEVAIGQLCNRALVN